MSNVNSVLIEAQEALRDGISIYVNGLNWRLHDLAEAQDEKAKSFFIKVLTHGDSVWREEALDNLGFHYDLRSDESVINIIRDLLISDNDSDVRLAAAFALGNQSAWPDRSLYRTLRDDNNRFVRKAAFRSLLRLSGLEETEVAEIIGRVESGIIPLSTTGLQSVIGGRIVDLQASTDDAAG
jgi:HEAT repeat protein